MTGRRDAQRIQEDNTDDVARQADKNIDYASHLIFA